jgi:hypothetical protein
MAVNKNFVVKHGLEVNDNLILANSSTKRVGIGSTIPDYTLDVAGGIGATHIYAAGISTFADDVEILSDLRVGTGGTVFSILSVGSSIGIGTNQPEYLVDIRSPVSTGQTALYIYGDVRITGDINADDLFFDDVVAQDLYVSGIGTIITLVATDGTITNLGSTNFVTTNLSGTVSTITNLVGTYSTISSLDVTDGSITNLVGTYSTISSLDVTDGSITNLVGTYSTISSLDVTNLNALANLTAVAATITSLSGTIATITEFNATDVDITNLNVSGISTLGTVQISSGIVTTTSGIVTYYGDGQYLQNVIGGIGIATEGGTVGSGATILDFRGAGISTVTVSSGIGTLYITGGGGGASVSISTAAPATPSSGDLWFSPDYARTFIWYDENTVGYGTSAAWVDASPSNGGSGGGASVSISTAAPTSPNNGDLWFSVDLARTFIYYDENTIGIGSTAVWVDAAPHNPANSSLTIFTRSTGAVVLSIVGTGLTISLRSGVGTASF